MTTVRLVYRAALLTPVMLVATACSWIPKPETAGMVSVSRPLVFTRERLVAERLREANWLKEQLNRPFTPTFQGLSDERVFQGVYENLAAKYSPLSGAVNDQALRDQLRTLRQQKEIGDLQNQLNVIKLQQDIAKQQAAGTGGYTPPPAPPASGDVTALTNRVTALEKSIADLKGGATNAPFLGLSTAEIKRPALPDSSKIDTTNAQLTGKDRFEDEAAFRDLVQSRLREKQLDDTHDLRGTTIYELKFDVSLMPGSSTRRYAVVAIKIRDGAPSPNLFSRWQVSAAQDIIEESLSLQRRAQTGIAVDPTRLPQVYQALTFYTKPLGGTWAALDGDKLRQPSATRMTATLNVAGATPFELLTDLRVQLTRDGEARSVYTSGPQSLVYFANITERSATATPTTVALAGGLPALELRLPGSSRDLFFKAYQGLQQALHAGSAAVVLTVKNGIYAVRVPAPASDDGVIRLGADVLTAQRSKLLPGDATQVEYTVTIEYQHSGSSDPGQVPVTSTVTFTQPKPGSS